MEPLHLMMYVSFGLHIATLGFLWSLHQQINALGRDLGERVARIEGILQSHGMNGTLGRRIRATDEMPSELRGDGSTGEG